MAAFDTSLNYSSVNEDWRTEAAALAPLGAGPILCVAGSGSRPLDLLGQGATEVTAIDINPSQTALLALKATAIDGLNYSDYTAFLGLRAADPRWRLDKLEELLPRLGSYQRHCSAMAPMIARGILYQGRWERFFRRVARLTRLLRPQLTRRLFEFEELTEQRRFLEQHWDRWWWRWTFRLLCSGPVLRWFGDPAFYHFSGSRTADFLYQRMRSSLERTLARENFMVSLLLLGRLSNRDLPPHLSEVGVAEIRNRIGGLKIISGDVMEAVGGTDRYCAYSLSDVPSFLSADDFQRLLDRLARTALPGARFCIRQFLSRHTTGDWSQPRLRRNAALEQRLTEEDHAFAYDFIVGTAD